MVIALYGVIFTFLLSGRINVGAQNQEKIPAHQISVQHDNDFLLGVDRYYTTGSFIGYSKVLTNDFIFKNTVDTSLQLDVLIAQEIYTPRELFSTDFNDLERPYAGYLYTSASINQTKKDQIWSVAGEFGLAGPHSFGGDVQTEYHKFINEFIPSWAGEIENSVHINAYGDYVKSFQNETSFFVDLHSRTALGTRQIFAGQQATVFFGNRSSIDQSSFYNRVGRTSELYGYGGVYYRYVGLNALIQGHPWGDASPFTLRIENQLVGAKLGVVLRRGANTFQLEYVTQTNETMREGQVQYTSAVFKRAF